MLWARCRDGGSIGVGKKCQDYAEGSSVLAETLKFHCPEGRRVNETVYRKTGGMKECVFRDQGGSQNEFKAVRNGYPLIKIRNEYWLYNTTS